MWLIGAAVGSIGSAQAAVVIDPIPPVTPGLTLALQPFTTIPASAANTGQDALLHSLQPIGDGSGRLFVNDTRGLIWSVGSDGAAKSAWFDIRTQDPGFSTATNPSQTGLMGFALHPNFGKDPTRPGYATFYTIDTSAPTGSGWSAGTGPVDHDDIVHEWTVADPHAATATVLSEREVMRVAQPYSDHGPGTIAFNPAAAPGSADYGKLYIGLGDGGGENDPLDSAQSLTSPFGKILRIDPADPDGAGPKSYSVPADNPFAGREDARGEVWATGLRNPQHFSWDKAGTMLISDIGQAQIEEVNVGTAGANYGWPAREGLWARGTDKGDTNIYDTPANNGLFTDPIGEYDHQEIFQDGHTLAAIGGSYLYEGSAIPQLDGMVVLSDLVTGRLFTFDPDDARPGAPATLHELLLTLDGQSVTMLGLEGTSNDANGRVDLRLGLDADGELYLLTKKNGDIYRLVNAAGVPEPATWAMLIAGFGLVGWSARCSKKQLAST